MTAYRFVTIDCDRCGISFTPDAVVYIGLARELARERGWTRRWNPNRTRADWCSTCSKRPSP